MAVRDALEKAWSELEAKAAETKMSVRFLYKDYSVDLSDRSILSVNDNKPLNDYHSIIVLHYLLREQSIEPGQGKWISFKGLAGGDVYYSVFRVRAIEPLIKRYGRDPDGFVEKAIGAGARKSHEPGHSVEIDLFDKVPVLVSLFEADDELPAEATILFKSDISRIFPTEDVAVIGEMVSGLLR